MKRQAKSTIRTSAGSKIFDVCNVLILTLLSLVCIYPVWYVLAASLSESSLLMQHTGPLLKPVGFSFSAYKAVLKNPMILSGYLNTLKILILGLATNIVMTSLGAYFLSRKGVLWKKPIMILITITMFISGGMIPFYQTLQDFHLTDTHWGLILPLSLIHI